MTLNKKLLEDFRHATAAATERDQLSCRMG